MGAIRECKEGTSGEGTKRKVNQVDAVIVDRILRDTPVNEVSSLESERSSLKFFDKSDGDMLNGSLLNLKKDDKNLNSNLERTFATDRTENLEETREESFEGKAVEVDEDKD